MPNPTISIPAGQYSKVAEAQMYALLTTPACPEANINHAVMPGEAYTKESWDLAAGLAAGTHGMVDGLAWSRNPSFAVEGIPLHTGRTYEFRCAFYCQVKGTGAHGGHIQWENVDIVTTGDFTASVSDAALHHTHADIDDIEPLSRVLNRHHHMHANSPETLAIAAHTAELQRLSVRVAALENARGEVVGDGTPQPDNGDSEETPGSEE